MKPSHRSLAILLALVLVASAATQWWGATSEQRRARGWRRWRSRETFAWFHR